MEQALEGDAEGVIRQIGAGLDSGKFGFCSTLAAVSVEPDLVEKAAKIIGEFLEVTHSYHRKEHFNIWFTIIAADQARVEPGREFSIVNFRLPI